MISSIPQNDGSDNLTGRRVVTNNGQLVENIA